MSAAHQGASNAFVTLLTSDSYLPGVLVLAESLRLSHGLSRKGKQKADGAPFLPSNSFQLVALITPETLSVQSIRALRQSGLYDWIVGVEPIGFRQVLSSTTTSKSESTLLNDSTSVLDTQLNEKVLQMEKNLGLLGRPDLVNTLTKLHTWRLGRDCKDLVGHMAASPDSTATWQGFDKIVFLDADTLALRRIDHLFRLSGDPHFAAAPDTGWPDAFNSGVMLLKPSASTFEAMRKFARSTGSWDGADQGLLNDFFGAEMDQEDVSETGNSAPGGGWKRLSFRYNVTCHGGYTFAPAYQRYGSSINVVHFIGQNKPWNRSRPAGHAVPNPLADPTNLGSQSVTPDHPDYLLSLWHSAFASLYPSSATASPRENFTIVHTERGVEVIETPRFSVPTYHAVWDMEAEERQDSQANSTEAVYVSLPLDGRISLIAPVPQVPSPIASPKPASPLPIPGSYDAHHEQDGSDDSPEHYSPPKLTWNAAQEPPPTGTDASSYQMRVPIDTIYANKWDEASRNPRSLAEQKAAFFVPVQAQSHQHGGPGYIPPKLLRDNVFANLGSSRPDPTKVKPVFPWEVKPNSGSAKGRVFPDDPRMSAPEPVQSGRVATASSAPRSVPNVPATRRGLPNNLAYVNAWDQAGAIGTFADRWTKRASPVSPAKPRQTQQSGNSSTSAASDQQGRRFSPSIQTVARGSGQGVNSELQPSGSGDEASDSRDGDDESSFGSDESDLERVPAKHIPGGPAGDSSRGVSSPREKVARGHSRKVDVSTFNQTNPASHSPRIGSRPLSYTSPANESTSGGGGDGRSGGRFSSSSSASHSTITGDSAATRQRARDRIRPDGWVSPTGNFNSPPKQSGYNPATASLRGIPGVGAISGSVGSGSPSIHRAVFPAPAAYGRRREFGSSNESQSASGGSGANSPTALLSPSLGHLPVPGSTMFYPPQMSPLHMPGGFPSRTRTPPGSSSQRVPSSTNMEEPFSSSPLNSRSELSQQARVHRQARPSANKPYR